MSWGPVPAGPHDQSRPAVPGRETAHCCGGRPTEGRSPDTAPHGWKPGEHHRTAGPTTLTDGSFSGDFACRLEAGDSRSLLRAATSQRLSQDHHSRTKTRSDSAGYLTHEIAITTEAYETKPEVDFTRCGRCKPGPLVVVNRQQAAKSGLPCAPGGGAVRGSGIRRRNCRWARWRSGGHNPRGLVNIYFSGIRLHSGASKYWWVEPRGPFLVSDQRCCRARGGV